MVKYKDEVDHHNRVQQQERRQQLQTTQQIDTAKEEELHKESSTLCQNLSMDFVSLLTCGYLTSTATISPPPKAKERKKFV